MTALDSPPVRADEQAEFDHALAEARKVEAATPVETPDGHRVVWSPQPGSQTAFLSCPVGEVLYHGTRGPGKTDALLMSFAQHVGRGFGRAWRGIIFRQTYPQLADVQAKSEKWFRLIFPAARFNRAAMRWEWPDGESLALRHMLRPQDYWHYHGHEYPFIGFEELTNWPTDECYRSMFSCNRSSTVGVPRLIRATTNPYGVGHSWVKDRWRLHDGWWKTIVITDAVDTKGKPEPPRVAIHGHIDENKRLLEANPDYKDTIRASATNEGMAEAWLNGSWAFVAGGMFDDVWSERNVVPELVIPPSWTIDRAFDWGSSKPFSVGWYAVSDGSDVQTKDGRWLSTVRGDLFRIREWYGWTGRPNEGKKMLAADVAKGIVERELIWEWRRGSWCRVSTGVADSAIFVVEDGHSIAQSMEETVRIEGRVYPGVSWLPADKKPGSRKSGWEMMRRMIANASPPKEGPREKPGLFVVDGYNPQFVRTILALPRDQKDLDDVDTDSEDHIADEVRYRVRAADGGARSGRTVGGY